MIAALPQDNAEVARRFLWPADLQHETVTLTIVAVTMKEFQDKTDLRSYWLPVLSFSGCRLQLLGTAQIRRALAELCGTTRPAAWVGYATTLGLGADGRIAVLDAVRIDWRHWRAPEPGAVPVTHAEV